LLAAQDAQEDNQEWLEAANNIATTVESDVTTTLRRLRGRVALLRSLRAVEDDPTDVTETATEAATEDAGAKGGAEDAAESLTERAADDSIMESGFEDGDKDFDPFEDDDADNPLSDINHVKRLREMADLLNRVADALTVPAPD
jgi:hypothetical protein